MLFNKKKKINIKVVGNGEGLDLPTYQRKGDAGMDLRAAINEMIAIPAGDWVLVPCGFSIELPTGYEAQIRSRSGYALKEGLFVLNAPGTIDPNYRGEVGVILANFGKREAYIKRGDRVAQMVIARYENVSLTIKENLGMTKRGESGFGSSGKN